jgi:hypothetical protein
MNCACEIECRSRRVNLNTRSELKLGHEEVVPGRLFSTCRSFCDATRDALTPRRGASTSFKLRVLDFPPSSHCPPTPRRRLTEVSSSSEPLIGLSWLFRCC